MSYSSVRVRMSALTLKADPEGAEGRDACKQADAQAQDYETFRLDVEHRVFLRPGTADQDIPPRRWIERIRLVAHGPRNQPTLAVVTDTGAARPPDGYLTRLGQFEKALIVEAPAN